ncbi:MAG: AbrB/MazE/SpoVT family DNA-binding domain-containing protein [Opitutaceae bacterium]|nr:AbrB/MazE/SpoVT family DNA-binding domain-containing protein [Opitutaceae bacterium]
MQLTLSSKGQLVLPAPVRRRLRLQARSKVELEEREDGVFIRPAAKAPAFAPIAYPPPGSLKVNQRLLSLDKLAGPDVGPDAR